MRIPNKLSVWLVEGGRVPSELPNREVTFYREKDITLTDSEDKPLWIQHPGG